LVAVLTFSRLMGLDGRPFFYQCDFDFFLKNFG
jgi:hypothetical protein